MTNGLFIEGDRGTMVTIFNVNGVIADNLIHGNTLSGTEGLGIFSKGGDRNQYINNTIRGATGSPLVGAGQSGTGSWFDPESKFNQVLGNTFRDNASCDVVLRGDQNTVALEEENDSFVDRGSGNRVLGGTRCRRSAPEGDQDETLRGALLKLSALLAEVRR